MNTSATINLFFDQRRAKKDGTYPVKLSVYYLGEKRRYNTLYSATPAEWVKINGARLKDASLKDLKSGLDKVKQDASSILDDLEEFDFDSFERRFFANNNGMAVRKGLVELYTEVIDIRRKNGNEGSARSYHDSLNALLRFKKNLSFKDITPEFLNAFERDFVKNGKSPTSVGIYMRQLRAIINEAINRGLVKREDYAFARYKIPGGYNKKKALSSGEIETVMRFESDAFLENQAIAFWKLSFLCGGMNIGDLLRLKKENISGDIISFNRSKTINTRKSASKTIQVGLIKQSWELIEVWGKTEGLKKDDYIFPVLNHTMTAAEQKDAIKSFNRKINQQLEKIADKLQLSGRLSNMTARHSFATTLKRKHVSAEVIGDFLGHANIKTTQNYLDSFTHETIIDTTKKLIQFD